MSYVYTDDDLLVQPPVQFDAAVELFLGLKKLAAESAPPVAAAEPTSATEVVEAPAETPVEEPAAAPVAQEQGAAPDVVGIMAQCVAHELKQQVAYVYYAEMMTGAGRGELSRIFKRHAAAELKDAAYLLQRIAAIQPGGVPIPPSPTPVPTSDPQQALQILIQGEAHAITLLQTLHLAVAEDPMKYAVEAMLVEEQIHHDELSRFLDAPTAQGKIKAAAALLKTAARQPQGTAVPEAGNEPTKDYVAREQALAAEQATAEGADAAARVEQLQAALESKAVELSNATMESEGLQQQMAQQQQVSEQATAQAQMATQQSVEAQNAATAEADKVMRLSQRIQQFRQQLMQLVASDPVGEELGAADGGAPATPQQAAEGAAEEQAAAAEQGGPQAAMEVAQAQEAGAKAQGAAAQTAGALAPEPAAESAPPAAEKKPAEKSEKKLAKPDKADNAKVEVKVGSARSVFHDFYTNRAKASGVLSSAGEAAGRNFVRGAGKEVAEAAGRHSGKLLLGAGALGIARGRSAQRQRTRDQHQHEQTRLLQTIASK